MSRRRAFVAALACWTVLIAAANQAWARGGEVSLCCPADITGNGAVDAADLAVLLGAWESAWPDLDGDGVVGAPDLAILLGAWGPCPQTTCVVTRLVGTVTLEGGAAVESAVVVTDQGGQGLTGVDGGFSFDLEVAKGTSSLQVTAVASIGGVTYSGTKTVSQIVQGGVSDAGVIVVSEGGSCDGEFAWLPRFGLPGMNGVVYALTVFDDGSGSGPELYAAGLFDSAGGAAANQIAKWSGTSWSPLGTGSANGVNGSVLALTVFDDGSGGGPALYAGGDVTTAGGVPANRIAKWNGTSWSPLVTGSANGVNGSVLALTVFDDGSGGGPALYAGGFFTTAGGVAANRIAKWNGTSWSSLGTGSANGVNGWILALTVFDDGSGGGPALYAGGNFTTAGGVPSNCFAQWGCVLSGNDAADQPQGGVAVRRISSPEVSRR